MNALQEKQGSSAHETSAGSKPRIIEIMQTSSSVSNRNLLSFAVARYSHKRHQRPYPAKPVRYIRRWILGSCEADASCGKKAICWPAGLIVDMDPAYRYFVGKILG